jgi:uncharacterized RDD family membrane protein YckC
MTAFAAQAPDHGPSPAEIYIHRVLAHLPSTPALRAHIAMDLRSHIAERMEQGQSIDDVVRQLGDPSTLAESYLGAVPLIAATFGDRAIAKIIDFGALWIGTLAVLLVAVWLVTDAGQPRVQALFFVVPLSLGLGSLALVIYTIAAEYRTGQTLGKRLRHLRVVRESGASISLGQSFVRQFPTFLQIGLVDCLFALFTDKNQRAFEIISKTRVVHDPPDEPVA